MCPPRFAYKDEYEKFKLYLTIILILISFTCRFLLNSRWVSCGGGAGLPDPLQAPAPTLHTPAHRVTDAAFNFLLVWYYCTLTIRESILINNGSRWARAGPRPQGGGAPLELPCKVGGSGGAMAENQGVLAPSHCSPASCPPSPDPGAEGTGVTAAPSRRIKGWWVFHHYVSTFLSGVMLTW